jgi:preprotein translocase subunit SecE
MSETTRTTLAVVAFVLALVALWVLDATQPLTLQQEFGR